MSRCDEDAPGWEFRRKRKEALENGKDAVLAWVAARMDMGKKIPEPKTKPIDYVEADVSGRFPVILGEA